MSSSSVWVQLYYTGEEEDDNDRDPVGIEPPYPKNIHDLKRRLKKDELKEELQNCGLSGIKIYPPRTKPPFSESDSMRPDKLLEKVIDELKKNTTPPTSADHPLIVVAPPPKQAYVPAPEKDRLALVKIEDLANFVNDGSISSCVRSCWRRELGKTTMVKLFLRPHLLLVKKHLETFIAHDIKTRLYVSGPPGCGKTTFFLHYFTEYALSKAKKGLLVQFCHTNSCEIIVIDGRSEALSCVRNEGKEISASDLLGVLKSFVRTNPASKFDFIIFDGVRQSTKECLHVLGYINANFYVMNVHITSLEFDIKGGDGSAGSKGPDEYLQMDSWTYEDYKAAYNDKGFMCKQEWLSLLGTVAEIEKNTTSGNEVDANQFTGAGKAADDSLDGDSDSSMDTGNSSNKAADAWLESLMERKFYYAGGSARLMFDFNLNDLVNKELDRLEDKAGQHVWRELAKLQIHIKSGGVSSLLQRLNKKVFPVSKYFLYKAYRACRGELVSSLKTAAQATDNPAMKGWAFELEQVEIVAAEMEWSNSVTNSGTAPTLVVPISNTWAEYNGNKIQIQGGRSREVFSIRCTKWNQGCFDLAFYFQGHLLTVNFTISTSHSLKVQYLRLLRRALEDEDKFVEKMTHIVVVPDVDICERFKFDKPEGNGYEQGTHLFTLQVGCSSKLVAAEARNLEHNHSIDAKPKLEMKKLDDVVVCQAQKSKRVKLQGDAFVSSERH